MAEYSLKNVRDFFEQRARDVRLRSEPMVLSGYGRPEDGAAWWTAEPVRAALFADIVRKLFDEVEPARVRVLEVGCAGGNLLRHLTGMAHRVVGVDLSLAMLRVAGDMRLPGVSLLQANGVALPFLDRTFDRVLCYSVVTNFPDEATVERLLAETLRVLDHGGRVLVGNTPDRRKAAELQEFLARTRRPTSRLRKMLDTGRAAVRRALQGPPPAIRNLSFDPGFFVEVARRHGARANVLPLDVAGYTYAPFRFDVELVKA